MGTEFKDYFAVLQLEPSCTLKDLRRSYRRLARSTHPDCNKERGASRRFLEVQEAYEVLKNPAQRKVYEVLWHKTQKSDLSHVRRERKEIRKKQRRVVFYHQFDPQTEKRSSEKILETFDLFYDSLLKTWGLNRPENPPQFILDSSKTGSSLQTILQELNLEHGKNRRLEAWEFTGDFLVESLLEIGQSLDECLDHMSLLLHDRASHDEPWLTGYAVYSIKERFEIWSDDSFEQFARLVLILEKLFHAKAPTLLKESVKRPGKLDIVLWILHGIREGQSSAEITKNFEGQTKASELSGAIRILEAGK